MKLTGISLTTDDVGRLAAFYARVLQAEARGDDWHTEVLTEGAGLVIMCADGMEEMAPGSGRGAGHGGALLMVEVDDVDAEYERMAALGVEMIMLPTTHPWGARSFWFRDPDGNIVDFHGRP